MTWYQSGSVTVTQGSATIIGAGTDFMVPNVFPGDGFVDEAGYTYEVVSAQSSTQLTISPAYRGASGAGRGYKIMPLQDYQRLLAQRAADLIGSFAAVRDGVGQGLFADGSSATPGVRFASDQDTGIARVGANALSLVAGGNGIMNLSTARIEAYRPINMPGSGSIGYVADADRTQMYGSSIANYGVTFGVGAGEGTPATVVSGYGGVIAVTSGAERVRINTAGNLGIGATAPATKLHVAAADQAIARIRLQNVLAGGSSAGGYDLVAGVNSERQESLSLYNVTTGRTAWTVDGNGNLLVGVTSGAKHVISKAVDPAVSILEVARPTYSSVEIFGADSAPASGVAAVMKVTTIGQSGRSISAGGTINASGADYAEYVRKSPGCGTILKGDPCGLDRNGELTRTWADAMRYVVKSTDPNLVGGDTWATHLGPRPEAPLYAAPVYDGPAVPVEPLAPVTAAAASIELPERPARAEDEDDDAYLLRLAAYLNDRTAAIAAAEQTVEAQATFAAAQARYDIDLRQYRIDQAAYDQALDAHHAAVAAAEAAHAAAMERHAEALTAWEAELEAARQTVDRIAFSGQVPVNVDAEALTACEAALADGVAVYLVAVARGAGIGVTAVREADMTLPLYMRRLGAVWAIRDGRPWIDVQHG